MNIYEEIINIQKQRLQGILITVTQKEGHGPQIPGAKLLVCSDDRKIGTIGGGTLEHTAINEAKELIKSKKSISKKYILDEDNQITDGVKTGMMCGGSITLFYDYIGTKEQVIIFGSGHVGKSLAYYLKPLDFDTLLIDTREEILDTVDFCQKCQILNYNEIPYDKLSLENSYIVITTHSHEFDYKVLKSIYESGIKPKYIGMIASKKKSEKMIQNLVSDLNKKPNFDYLYTPIGLKIGGSSPQEIALSIASELQTIKYNQSGNKHAKRNWREEITEL